MIRLMVVIDGVRRNLVFVLSAAFIFAGGCAKEHQIASSGPLCLSGVDVSTAMSAAEKVLVAFDFHIDKMDPVAGYISTNPLGGAQFFEFWRKDNADSYKAAMSNIHSIRRTVELNFKRSTDGTLCINCIVTFSRLAIPERKIVSSVEVYSIYSASDEQTQTLAIAPEQRKMMQWVKLGRDGNLEMVILKEIHRKITAKGSRRL